MFERLKNIPGTARSLLLAVGIAALAIIAFTANEARIDRAQRIVEAERNLDAISLALSSQVERDIQSARLIMGYARQLAARHDLERPGIGRDIYPALHNLALGMPVVSNLAFVSPAGVIVASSLIADQPPIAVADRGYFRHHQREPGIELHIGDSDISRTLGDRVVQLSQRIEGPHGEFAGIVVAALRHEYFSGMFQNFSPAEGGAVALVRRDGRLLARYPLPPDSAFAADYSDSLLFLDLTGSKSGRFRTSTSIIDGAARFYSFRILGELPLIVVVSQRQDAVFKPWHEAMARQVGVAVLALACMGLLGAMVLRQLLGQESQRLALAASEARFHTLFDSAADAIFLICEDGLVVAANAQACVTLDLPLAAIEGRPLSQFLPEPGAGELLRALDRVQSGHPCGLEAVLQGKDGVSLPVEVRFSRLEWGGERLLLGLARDISERKAYQSQLERLASFDELTQVPKRSLFMDRLEQALSLARRNDRQVGVLFVDLDRFKAINDSLGHACGDEVLQHAARRMLGTLREVDTVGRYGGDEFVVLLPEITQTEDIETVAIKLCDAFQAPFELRQHAMVVNVSIGVAIFPRDGETAEALVRHADEAMYAAKLAGRNQVQHYFSA